MQAAVFYLFQYVSPQHLSCWVYQLWLADLSLRVAVTDRSTHRGLTFIIIQAPCRNFLCCSALGDTNDNKTAVGPEDVSKMGCPCLGEHTRLEVVIEESYEFKVTQNQQLCNSEHLMPAYFEISCQLTWTDFTTLTWKNAAISLMSQYFGLIYILLLMCDKLCNSWIFQ